MCACVCVRACVRACVRVCVCLRVYVSGEGKKNGQARRVRECESEIHNYVFMSVLFYLFILILNVPS